MKGWRKNSTLFCCILTSVLLGGLVCCSKAQVTITTPPENATVCRSSHVTISCGYTSATALPVTWIINGTSFTQEEIMNSPLYQLNNPTSPMRVSLTVFSINGTTTFQCIVQSTPNTTTSTRGTVTVTNVNFMTPPQDKIVCRGNNVFIECGYQCTIPLSVTWIINGTSFTQEEIVTSPLYQLNNSTDPKQNSLLAISVNGNTTFRCVIQSTPSTISKLGTVNVIERPVVEIATVTGGCGYVYVSWTAIHHVGENDQCNIISSEVTLSSATINVQAENVAMNYYNFTGLPGDTLFNATVISVIAGKVFNLDSTVKTTVKTMIVKAIESTPIMITANVSFTLNTIVITVSWQVPPITSSCTANITMYNITVMDQYSPAIVTVPANMLSVEINQFPDNGTRVVDNREYTITVSAISDQGASYPSVPVVVDTFILQNCDVTSSSVGTIRVSCDSSHQIQVTALCASNCNMMNVIMTSNGYSPLTVRELDPGKRYTVTINVFDGNQVVLNDKRITKTITVRSTTLGASSLSSITSSPTTVSSLTSSPTTTSSLSPTITASFSLSKTTTTTSTISLSSTTSSSSTRSLSSTTTSLASPQLPSASSDSAGGDSSGGAIAGGVIGGIVVVIVIIIIIIVICYFIFYKNKSKGSTNDDRTKLKSPPGTDGTHASERDANVTTDNSAQYDKVVYAAPVQTVNIPHQASASGEQYAVSTKTVNKTSEQQLPQEHVEAPDTKKDFQGVTYADLQVLPSTDSGNKRFSNPHPASAYAELLM